MVDRLTKLVAIFENPALEFRRTARTATTLGGAYEYLMRHFATESGKSKGQLTCGSGSLLSKVADEAGTPVALYGQEKDAARRRCPGEQTAAPRRRWTYWSPRRTGAYRELLQRPGRVIKRQDASSATTEP
jgi:hypothetical protein